MNKEKLLSLIMLGTNEDRVLAINHLAKLSKEEIMDFFEENGNSTLGGNERDSLTLNHFEFNIHQAHIDWKYYYKGDIGFYLSNRWLQLFKHPNATYKDWNPEEL